MARRIVQLLLCCVCVWSPAPVSPPRARAQLSGASEPPAERAGRAPAGTPLRRAAAPWPRRRRTGVIVADEPGAPLAVLLPQGVLSALDLRRLGLRPRRSALLATWPREPAAPPAVYLERFAPALAQLCPPGREAQEIGGLSRRVLRAAAEFGVDPTLLGAVVYHQSRCDPAAHSSYGVGLAQIDAGMHARFVRARHYLYHVRGASLGWRPRSLRLPEAPLSPDALRDPLTNLRYAAAILHVFERQCPAIDRAFGSAPHRHFVSHFVFGDRVRHATPEDQILVARRRLLAYYERSAPPAATAYRGLALGSALDGPPRFVIGRMGDPRDGGARAHAGVDLASALGEPVRAVAAGYVRIAGADRPDGELVSMDAAAAEHIAPGRTGPRGLFVMLEHGRGLSTLYAHLATYVVQTGQYVQPGQLLGYVGRTGMRTSDAHLHFGLFVDGVAADPLPVFAPYAVAPARPPLPLAGAAVAAH